MNIADKYCHMAAALLLVVLTAAAHPHPLEDAAERATALCFRFDDVESLNYCGFQMLGRSQERRDARAAVRRLFEVRAAFMSQCERTGQPLDTCEFQAEWYTGSGISRLNTVEYNVLPRSDARR